ncbi:hypothetical protein ONZ45_g10080 [Pleurotus djamor]|nr:hypothetical protein ONZ45_g10080 [Pleurotus djamor]
MKRVERRGTLESQQLAAQNAAAAAAAANAANAQPQYTHPQPPPPQQANARTIQAPPSRTDTLPASSSFTLRPERDSSASLSRSAIANSQAAAAAHHSSSSSRRSHAHPPSPPSIATLPDDSTISSRVQSRSNSRSGVSRPQRPRPGGLSAYSGPPPAASPKHHAAMDRNGARRIGSMRMEVDDESPTGGSGDGDLDADADAEADGDGDEGDTLRELAEAAGVRSRSGSRGGMDDEDAEAEADAEAELLEAVDAAEAAEANSSGSSAGGDWMKSESL